MREPWFAVRQVEDGVSVIVEQYASPLLLSNSWHIRGSRGEVLFDTGLGVVSMRTLVLEELAEDEPIVVLSHSHLDHMGSAHEFSDVRAHALEPVDQPGRGTLDGDVLGSLLGMDEIPEFPLPKLMLDALPSPDYDVSRYTLEPTLPATALVDGDIIDLGDRLLEVFHLPGHTPGSLALYEAHTQTLYAGDVAYDAPLQLCAIGHSADLSAHESSMRRLRDMQIETVHLGHGADMTGARLRQLIDGFLAWRRSS